MNDCFSYAQPGQPTLPVYPARLLLPEGSDVADIHVTSSEPQEILYDFLNKPILPEQEFVRTDNEDDPSVFMMDTLTYDSPSPVFDTISEDGGIGYCRGYAIQTVYLYPVQYTPKNGTLYYYPEMTVTIKITKPGMTLLQKDHPLLRNTKADHDVIRDLVANPSLLTTYTPMGDPLEPGPEPPEGGEGGYLPLDGGTYGLCDPAQPYQYVIITSESLKDTTGYPYNWTSLINHRKTYSDLDGIIITVQEIDACSYYGNSTPTFDDSPAHIREFCKDAYLNWGTEYIILGGDWDSTASHQIVPYRLFTDREETETYKTMACDMYFSHLDGDWYYSAQSIWGGGRNSGVNDLYGELYVGRIAAYNASMVSNAVQKIIWYDLTASGDWLAQASFLGGNLGWTATSKQYMEEIRLGTDTYRTFTGFEEWNTAHPETLIDTSERLYHADLGASYKTYFSDSIEEDKASIINHIDHSDWNSPFGLTSWLFRYNTKPFFGYSQGCLAGRFHEGYAGSEQLMCRHPERHAFALVLNTGYGYGSSSSTNGPSQYLNCFFWDYFFNNQSTHMDSWQLGKANLYAHDKMSTKVDISSHAWSYAWYSANYFGDPAQTLRLTDSSGSLTIDSENPTDGSTTVPITTAQLRVTIEHSLSQPFDYTIQTSPDIGSIAEQDQSNGQKTCAIEGLGYATTYHWYVNATDGTLTTNTTYTFTTQAAPVNSPPTMTTPSPTNESTTIPINTASLTIIIEDPEADFFNWTITTSPNIGSSQGTNATNGTKTCPITGLTYSTTYTWYVRAYDGQHWTNQSYWFTTEPGDLTPPNITTIQLRTSTPMDLEPVFGWENITCEITDDSTIDTVLLTITYPGMSPINHTMTKKTGTNTYYYNTSYSDYGNYTYIIEANDTHNNHATSLEHYFSLAPNWDINNDGECTVLDLTLVSSTYGQASTPGWIREDVDNNGQIQVLDLILISNYYGQTWDA